VLVKRETVRRFLMKSKLSDEQSARPVYDNAIKMFAAFKERNSEWALSSHFKKFECCGRCDCSKPCLWLEGVILDINCPLYQHDCKHWDDNTNPPTTEFNGLLDYWDKLCVSEHIMNTIIETPLSDIEVQNPDNYLNVREMAEQSGKTPQTIIKHIRQGKLWARLGKIRTNALG
jgi:hypothetical protein